MQATILPKKYEQYKEFIDVLTPCVYDVFLEVLDQETDKSIKLIINAIYKIEYLNNKDVLNFRIPLDKEKIISSLSNVQLNTGDNKFYLSFISSDNTVFDIGFINTNISNTELKRLAMEYIWNN
jgi:hypothetical protein